MSKAKSYEELKFTDDFMFCKVLGNNPELCKELLEMILQIKIRKVVCTNVQKPIEITSDGKGIRLDVYVEDDNNTVFDIEMQTTKQTDLPKRTRYYQGMIDLNLIERGALYRELKKSFIIFICLSDPFTNSLPVYRFENMCHETGELLNDESVKVFINAKGVLTGLSEDMKAFLCYLNGETVDNALVEQIESEVSRARLHEEWRTEYMTLLQRDQNNFDEGRKAGIKEGIKEEQLRTVKKFVAEGKTPEYIANFFEISKEEAESLVELTKSN